MENINKEEYTMGKTIGSVTICGYRKKHKFEVTYNGGFVIFLNLILIFFLTKSNILNGFEISYSYLIYLILMQITIMKIL